MCVCVCVHVYVCVRVCGVYVCVHVLYECTHTYVCELEHVCAYKHMCVYMCTVAYLRAGLAGPGPTKYSQCPPSDIVQSSLMPRQRTILVLL